jgi:hypothetical protein
MAKVWTWETYSPGWYEVVISFEKNNPSKHLDLMLEWIDNNIQGAAKHAVYMFNDEQFKIKFRHERDCIMFSLTWL